MKKLERASREELIEIVLPQQAEMAVLAARVEGLEAEVRRLRRGGGSQGELCIKPNRSPKQKVERKRRDG